MAKLQPAFFRIKLHGMMLHELFIAVSTPTVVPVSALAATVKLLIVIGINLSGSKRALPSKSPAFAERRSVA
jgi:hypothetical protein